jgi:hypothetical protein
MLQYDSTQPDIDTFLDFCKSQCSKGDYSLLLSAVIIPNPDKRSKNNLLRDWQDWEIALRNGLSQARGPELKMDPAEHLKGLEPPGGPRTEIYEVEPAIQESLSGSNPKATEDILDKKRWDKLDDLETGHFFDIEKLIIYYLKLQLLNRRNKFTRERGTENFDEIYQAITENLENFSSQNAIE